MEDSVGDAYVLTDDDFGHAETKLVRKIGEAIDAGKQDEMAKVLRECVPNPMDNTASGSNRTHFLCDMFRYGDPNILDISIKAIAENLSDHLQPHYKDQTILHSAVRSRNLEHVRRACALLKDHEIDINKGWEPECALLATSTACCTEWNIAVDVCKNGQVVLEFLLEQGLNVVNLRGDKGQTLLHYMAEALNVEGVRLLMKHGADPLAEDREGYCPWFRASRQRCLEGFTIMEELLNAVDFVKESKTGELFLRQACAESCRPAVEYLVGKGIDVNCWDAYSCETPLFLAVRREEYSPREDVVKFLLQNGADVNANQGAALSLALIPSNPNLPNLKCMIEAGADVDIQNENGHTLIMLKLIANESRELLLEYGADINAVAPDGLSVLWRAVECELLAGFDDIDDAYTFINKLLAHNIDIGISRHPYKGSTPLQLAYKNDCPDMCEILLDAGCSLSNMQEYVDTTEIDPETMQPCGLKTFGYTQNCT